MKEQVRGRNILFATWMRAVAAMMILMCHFASNSQSSWSAAVNQFFNLGVDIFFILSGFLFGTQGRIQNPWKWYGKRLKRIYIPLEIFLAVLAIIYLLNGRSVLEDDWIWLMFGLAGDRSGIVEARHTWFITALIFCYLATPLIDALSAKLKACGTRLLTILFVLIPALLKLVPSESVGTVFAPLCWYSLAFFMGRNYNKVKLTNKHAFITSVIFCGAMLLRFVTKYRFDGTILYDRYIVGYTSVAAAFCIFILFAWFFAEKTPNALIQFISDISFEIYLYHYIFTFGLLTLFGKTPSWATDCILVTIITIATAFVMNRLGNWVTLKLSFKEKTEG